MRARAGLRRGFSRLSDRLGTGGGATRAVETLIAGNDADFNSGLYAPDWATHALLEIVSPAYLASTSSQGGNGGAGGNDFLTTITPSDYIQCSLAGRQTGTTNSSFTVKGITKQCSRGGYGGQGYAGTGGTGKYAGGNGTLATNVSGQPGQYGGQGGQGGAFGGGGGGGGGRLGGKGADYNTNGAASGLAGFGGGGTAYQLTPFGNAHMAAFRVTFTDSELFLLTLLNDYYLPRGYTWTQ